MKLIIKYRKETQRVKMFLYQIIYMYIYNRSNKAIIIF